MHIFLWVQVCWVQFMSGWLHDNVDLGLCILCSQCLVMKMKVEERSNCNAEWETSISVRALWYWGLWNSFLNAFSSSQNIFFRIPTLPCGLDNHDNNNKSIVFLTHSPSSPLSHPHISKSIALSFLLTVHFNCKRLFPRNSQFSYSLSLTMPAPHIIACFINSFEIIEVISRLLIIRGGVISLDTNMHLQTKICKNCSVSA